MLQLAVWQWWVAWIPVCSGAPKQPTRQSTAERQSVHAGCAATQVRGLYMMMGRGLEALAEVPAGCVAAIGGLGAAILKSATLASSPACRPLAPMLFQVGTAAT